MGWVTYKGLQVPSASTGDAGLNLTANFQALADATNGTPGLVAFYGPSNVLTSDSQLIWDSTNHWLGIGTTPFQPLSLYVTLAGTSGYVQGAQIEIVAAPPTASTARYYALLGQVVFSSAINSNDTTTGAAGVFGGISVSGTGTIAKAACVLGQFASSAAGAVTDGASIRACAPFISGGFSITQYAGVNIEASGITGGFGVYQGGSSDTNYFAGKIGIGQTAPTALVHIKAGSATAGTAPLKLTAGTNLTTVEAGAVEYDGSKLYFTAIGARRSINLADGVITSTTSVASTTTETTAYTDTLPANELTVGRVLRVTLLGRYSTANATNTFTLRLKLGTTTLITIASTAASVTNVPLKIVLTATVRSTGGSGTVFAFADATINHTDKSIANTATTTIDTTSAENVVATVQWSASSASNSVSIDQAFVEFLN